MTKLAQLIDINRCPVVIFFCVLGVISIKSEILWGFKDKKVFYNFALVHVQLKLTYYSLINLIKICYLHILLYNFFYYKLGHQNTPADAAPAPFCQIPETIVAPDKRNV